MEVFVWNMAISLQLLFIIISSVIYIYLGEKSFKYYVLYNLCLIIYVVSRSDENYYAVENAVARFTDGNSAVIFVQILNFYIQIVFYTFYSIFALYFLDLDKRARRYFTAVLWILRGLSFLFLVFGLVCYWLRDSALYINCFIFIYLPVMLTIFVITVFKAIKLSGRHKNFFLFGVCSYVGCALIAFAGTFIPSLNMKNPIDFFYVGIILETLFFSLGLAYKVKIINDERNRVNNVVLQHKHQQQITKLQGLLEGEERERRRLAQELHDGISGDLAALKMTVNHLKNFNKDREVSKILDDLSETVDDSCLQLRELSHNLSPSLVIQNGLLEAVEQLCKKTSAVHGINLQFLVEGETQPLPPATEIHLYRIIQELVNNIVKHSGATDGFVKFEFEAESLRISVRDNGGGFDQNSSANGIGLSNIDSRVTFLNGRLQRTSTPEGTTFALHINLS